MIGGEVTQAPPRPVLPEGPSCAHSGSFLPSTHTHEAEGRRGGTPDIFPGWGSPLLFSYRFTSRATPGLFQISPVETGRGPQGTDASEATSVLSKLPGCRWDRLLPS